ncbi:potassium channel, subfamily K, member 16-like [Lampetra fluviatilis]
MGCKGNKTCCRHWWGWVVALAYFGYLLIGAAVFQALEKATETSNQENLQLEKLEFLRNYTCLDAQALKQFAQVVVEAMSQGLHPEGNFSSITNWDFSSSFFFAGTVVTTIGYGHLSPNTVGGQVFCAFYALFGIPFNVIVLNMVGKSITRYAKRLEMRIRKKGFNKRKVKVAIALLSLLGGTVLFLLLPPLVFGVLEGWTYTEGFYYAFITLSTIGFGDYVVGNNPNRTYAHSYRGLVALWIIFGIAWLAVIFNLFMGIIEESKRVLNKVRFKPRQNGKFCVLMCADAPIRKSGSTSDERLGTNYGSAATPEKESAEPTGVSRTPSSTGSIDGGEAEIALKVLGVANAH